MRGERGEGRGERREVRGEVEAVLTQSEEAVRSNWLHLLSEPGHFVCRALSEHKVGPPEIEYNTLYTCGI